MLSCGWDDVSRNCGLRFVRYVRDPAPNTPPQGVGEFWKDSPMRSSRSARKIVGVLSAAAVSALLVGGTAAVTAGDLAGHGLRSGSYSAGHGLSGSTTNGHGL